MANGYYGQQSGDVRATLAISQDEANYGTTRTLNLADGRVIPVTIPPGTRSGQEIRVEGQGQQITQGSPPGALILTVSVPTAENFGSQPYPLSGDNTPTEFMAPPPPPPAQPLYSGSNPGANFTNYPPQGQVPPTYGNNAYTTPAQAPLPFVPNAPYMGTQGQPPVVPPAARGTSRRPLIATIVIAALALIIIIGSILYYTTVYQPQQLHTQATATAGANAKNTTVAGTAQANGTYTAVAGATNTAIALPLTDYKNITAKTPDLMNDPLSNPSTNNWDTDANCSFKNGKYHAVAAQAGFFFDCRARATNFSHFLFQVKMTFLKGVYGGIFFRSDPNNGKYYLLRFNVNTGAYNLYVYSNIQASSAKTLLSGTSTSFNTGANSTNVIAVLARGKTYTLYVNSTYTDTVDDGTYAGGQIGVFAEDNQEACEIVFEQAQVWNA